MAAKRKDRKATDLAPRTLKTRAAESIRGGSTIVGNQASVKTIKWADPPEREVGQRSNKV